MSASFTAEIRAIVKKSAAFASGALSYCTGSSERTQADHLQHIAAYKSLVDHFQPGLIEIIFGLRRIGGGEGSVQPGRHQFLAGAHPPEFRQSRRLLVILDTGKDESGDDAVEGRVRPVEPGQVGATQFDQLSE